MAVSDVVQRLESLDLDAIRRQALADIRSGKKTRRQKGVKVLRAVDGLQRTGLQPKDLLVTKVPVIPAAFRPYTTAGETFIPGDANELYSDLIKAVGVHRENEKLFGASGAKETGRYLRSAVRAAYGYGDSPNPKIKARGVTGFLGKILGCHDDQTEILTQRRGWVLFRDLEKGEPVATVNPENLLLEWQIPTDYVDQPYCGWMFHFSFGSRLDAMVTPDHDMFFRNRKGKTKHARDLTDGWEKAPAYRMAGDRGRLWLATGPIGWEGGTVPEVPPQLNGFTPEDFAEWCGWWVAEGWLSNGKPGISQSFAANPVKHARLNELAARCNSKVRVHPRKDDDGEIVSTDWHYGDKDLGAWVVAHFGKDASNKKISQEIKNWSAVYLRSFVKGYLAGNGSARAGSDAKNPSTPAASRRGGNHFNNSDVVDDQSSFSTCSRQLADDLSEVFLKLGCTAVVPRPLEDTRQAHWKDVYDTTVFGRFNLVVEAPARGDFHTLQFYSGRVYCCTVDNHLLVTRRNGKILVSGNSNPKTSWVQQKLIAKPQDYVGRGVISPDPDLGMDELALPERMAWDLFDSHIRKGFASQGIPVSRALQMVKDKHPMARQMLNKVMRENPVIYSRAPAWHRHNVISGYAKLAEGDNVMISPLVTAGVAGDFDGDSVDLETPIILSQHGLSGLWTGREIEQKFSLGAGNEIIAVEGFKAWTYSGWSRVVSFSLHTCASKKKFRITLRNGVEFIVSEDHSLMVNREEVKPGSLTVGTALDTSKLEVQGTEGSYDQGVIFGHFLGDGCAEIRPNGGGGRISIACQPQEERDYLKTLWKAEYGVEPTDCGYGWFQIHVKALAEEFLRLCGRYSYGKFVHNELLSRSEEFLKGLLAGYILSDGSVETTRSGSYLVRTWSRSKRLRDGMSLVATMLGLPHTLRQRELKGETNYILSFGKEAIKLLDYRCAGSKGGRLRAAVSDYANLRKDDRSSQSARGNEVVKIEEVEYSDRMIDIEVESGEHVFSIIGGVVLHNTMAVHVPVMEEAVKDAKEKLLPSRMLFSVRSRDTTLPQPKHEMTLGTAAAQLNPSGVVHRFRDANEALAAINAGQVKLHDQVEYD